MTRRTNRLACKHPLMGTGTMENLARDRRSPDPVEQAALNERLSSLRDLPEDEFEAEALAWHLGERTGIRNGSELSKELGMYSVGHSHKRLKRFTDKVNKALTSAD